MWWSFASALLIDLAFSPFELYSSFFLVSLMRVDCRRCWIVAASPNWPMPMLEVDCCCYSSDDTASTLAFLGAGPGAGSWLVVIWLLSVQSAIAGRLGWVGTAGASCAAAVSVDVDWLPCRLPAVAGLDSNVIGHVENNTALTCSKATPWKDMKDAIQL